LLVILDNDEFFAFYRNYIGKEGKERKEKERGVAGINRMAGINRVVCCLPPFGLLASCDDMR
jgi:hypothetical protein